MSRLPPWLRTSLRTDDAFRKVQGRLAGSRLHTVCESAKCPNRVECWNRGTATLMILGAVCTRRCGFCAVPSGRPVPPDPGEPERVGRLAGSLGLRHVVITSVTRDDLPDGGASVFAETIHAIRRRAPGATVEVLTPDFHASGEQVSTVLDAGPDVFAHNLDTVRRLQPTVRPQASYETSLSTLRLAAARAAAAIKSGLMLGLGEEPEEILEAFRDLRAAGCEWLTLGQYLAPTPGHFPVARFVPPEEFEQYANAARALGFTEVASGPRVRSSYRAGDMIRPAAAGA
jgi:lipoic acid synthetase